MAVFLNIYFILLVAFVIALNHVANTAVYWHRKYIEIYAKNENARPIEIKKAYEEFVAEANKIKHIERATEIAGLIAMFVIGVFAF